MTPKLLTAVCALVLVACDGYAELPLPIRERGELTVVSADLHPDAVGRVEVRLVLPEDTTGPVFIVGVPVSDSPAAQVVSWATGPCDPAAAPDPLVLCLAVRTPAAAQRPEPFHLGVVVDARGDGRRFTLIGEVAAP